LILICCTKRSNLSFGSFLSSHSHRTITFQPFILLETGSTRMKNAGHVAGKTIFTVGLCSLI
ncbi:hypothetical protein BN871_BQ_00010, partial [Paenibacillus sp. P22]